MGGHLSLAPTTTPQMKDVVPTLLLSLLRGCLTLLSASAGEGLDQFSLVLQSLRGGVSSAQPYPISL